MFSMDAVAWFHGKRGGKMFQSRYGLVVVLAAAAAACGSGPHSSSGFRLPGYGDVERGKAAFVELKCNQCHVVAGTDLAKAGVATPIVLGGESFRQITDGYLVASIINPSSSFAPYPAEMVKGADGKSRMPEYADNISVRQLTDVVAFLQSRYVYHSTASDVPQF